jgi:hypothetical protein
MPEPLQFLDPEKMPYTDWVDPDVVERLIRGETTREVVKEVPSGQIVMEMVPDQGVSLKFDCECSDALPYCQATCCTIPGIQITNIEAHRFLRTDLVQIEDLEVRKDTHKFWMRRDETPQHRCAMQDRKTLACKIYADRPETCRDYHCTRHPSRSGWLILPMPKADGEPGDTPWVVPIP